MAEDTYSEVPYTTADQREVTIAVAGKTPRSASDFLAAASQYDKDGTMMPGFTVTQKDPQGQTAFETVSEPIQRWAGAQGQMARESQETFTKGGQQFPLPLQPDMQARSFIEETAKSADTPGKASFAGAMAALGPLRILSQTSGPASTVARSVVGGLGYGVGEELMGRKKVEPLDAPLMQRKNMEALTTAGAVVASDTVVGLFSKVLGGTLPQKAMQQIENDVHSAIAKAYPEAKFGGNQTITAIVSSSKAALDRLSAIGLSAVRRARHDGATQFVDDLSLVFPQPISRQNRSEFHTHVTKYNDAIDDLFDNIDVPKKRNQLMTELDGIKNDIMGLVQREIRTQGPNMSPQGKLLFATKLQKKMDGYVENELNYLAGANVFNALKNHNPGKGFDAAKFQEYIQSRALGADPGSLMEHVGMAAGRGKPGGVDSESIPSLLQGAPKWILDKMGVKIPFLNASPGTTYAGTVRGKIPYGTMAWGTNQAIQDFYNRKDKEE